MNRLLGESCLLSPHKRAYRCSWLQPPVFVMENRSSYTLTVISDDGHATIEVHGKTNLRAALSSHGISPHGSLSQVVNCAGGRATACFAPFALKRMLRRPISGSTNLPSRQVIDSPARWMLIVISPFIFNPNLAHGWHFPLQHKKRSRRLRLNA